MNHAYHKQFEPVAIYGKHEHEQAFLHLWQA
jgi:hypothetical protein